MFADVFLNAPDPGPDRCLWLPESLLDGWELPIGSTVELSYGLRSATASIGLVGNSGKNGRPRIVVPSEALARELNLVTGLEYRIARTGPGSIALGPVIGLMAEEGRRIDTARLADDAWKNLLQAYDEVKGLTILLGPDSVDWSSGLVNGRYYDPRHESGPWVAGRFPIPAAVYRRVPLPVGAENDWLQRTSDRLFNARWHIDWWELHQAISTYSEFGPRLAPCRLASSFHVVLEALDRAQSVLLRPRSSEGGPIRVERTKDGFEALYHSGDHDSRRLLRTAGELRSFLIRRKVLDGRAVIQERVPTATIGGQRFELRLLVQRSGTGEFCCPGRLARLAPPESSARSGYGGILLPVDLALTAALRVSLEEAREVERRVVEWCCNLVRRLEEDMRTLGDVGVDVAIAPDGEIWLIDCDLRPEYSLFANFDKGMYQATSTMWHRFASCLAGFPVTT